MKTENEDSPVERFDVFLGKVVTLSKDDLKEVRKRKTQDEATKKPDERTNDLDFARSCREK